MHVTAIKTWAPEVGESDVSLSNPDSTECEDGNDEHRHSLDGENAEFQRHRGRHRIEQASTEDVGRVRQRVGEARRLYCRRRRARGEEHGRGEEEDEERERRHDLERLGRLQDDGQGDRERAKEHRPEEQRPAMRSAPSQVGAKLAPSTGNAKPNTSREPATPMISVAKMMLRMY